MAVINIRIKEMRTELNITQGELAERLGLDRSTISKWEKPDGTEPDSQTIAKLADIFNVSTDYLLGRTNQRKFDLNIENIAAMRSKELEGYDDLPDEAKEMLQIIIKEYYERFGKKKGKSE